MKHHFSSRLLALLLTLLLVLSLFPAALAAEALPFTDVKEGSWYYPAVSYVYEHNLMNGTSKTEFSPGEPLTRGMLVTVLYRAEGQPTVSFREVFQDVPAGKYYSKPVIWALDQNITKGLSADSFGPMVALTREQLATFLFRYAKGKGIDTGKRADLSVFPDEADTSKFARTAMEWAVAEGILRGVKVSGGPNELQPGAPATRAEVATMLMRFFQAHPDQPEEPEPPEPPQPNYVTLKLFETTDVHGYLLDSSSGDEASFQYRLAYLAKVFNDARADEAYDDVLLFDGGDIYQGTPVSNLLYGNAIRAAYDVMQYDAVALGNHEFDWGVDVYAADPQGTMPAYTIGSFSGDSDIPVLAYNLYDAGTTNRAAFVKDYVVLEKAGLRIAVVGYIPNYRGDIMAARINPYDIDPDIGRLAEKVKAVNAAEQPDLTIVLAHASPASIARSMDPAEVDLVLGGHSHSIAYGVADNGIPYLQGNCQAQGYATATITVETLSGEIQVKDPSYVGITGNDNKANLLDTEGNDKLDPTVLAISKAAWDAVKDDMAEVLGWVDQSITKNGSIGNSRNSVAGNWIATLMMEATKEQGTVAAFHNPGGIRTSLNLAEGAERRDITVGDIYTISPFGNHLLVYELTGAELAQQLVNGTKNANYGSQFSGFVATYRRDGRNYEVSSITMDDGTVVDIHDNEKTYTVVVNEYCATLDGAVFNGKTPVVDVSEAPIDNESLIAVLRAQGQENDGKLPLDLTPRFIPEVEELEFEFLVTSDIHGQFFATDYTLPYEQSGSYRQGMTRVASYLKEQKALYGDKAYLVDLGDTFQGAPLTYYYAFNKPDVEDPAIKTFRSLGYDMWIVGNHEFNYGLEILNRQMAYAISPATETESQLTISMANYLKAETNSDESKDWATWRDYPAYVIKDFGGVKAAVIGFGNPNIPKWDVPANWEGIYFANIIDTYKHYEAEMLEQADIIVVVAHSGLGSDVDSDFMRRLVEQTDTIAFAFSGHEHGRQIARVKNAKGEEIPILQPGTKANTVARVVVNRDLRGKITVSPELVNMSGYPLDEDTVALLQPYETDVWENYMLQPIGKALGDYPSANLGTEPSAFMDLINYVQTWGAYDRTGLNTPDKPEDDTPAMLSISAPLTSGSNANLISEGDIYLGDMFGLYRFENWFYQITMSGEEVHQWLEYAASKIQVRGDGSYNIQGGLTYYDVIYGDGFHYDFDVSQPAGERVINMSYKGKPVKADQVFTVVVNNYRYNGGGNYVAWLNSHGCDFTPNDPARIIYSTQFDMIQGEDEGQARTLLVRYIEQETEAKGGIMPKISSDWQVYNGVPTVTDIDLALDPHHGTILHTWCWNFNTIRENMSEIAAAGFSAIQCPPVASCAGSRMQINGGWYFHYQPNEYIIGNYQMGTRDEFIAMCEEAHKYGITVIVDTVINHVTTSTVHEAITSIPNWRHNNSGSWNQDDRYHLTQFALSGLPDLNTQNPEIQQMIKDFLVDCVNCGADGFRFDAAKLIELPDDTAEGYPDFASDFWPFVLDNGATFQYGEDLQEGNEPIIDLSIDAFSSRLGAYQEYMNTTASFYGWMLRDQVEKDDLSADIISDWLLPEDASETKIITWVESHDNYCNDASYRELDEQEVIQAWAVIAGRRGGTPLFFDRPMNSTASNPWGNDRIGPAGSNMYKDPQVVAVNFMRNELGDAKEALYNPNGDSGVLIIERGNKAAVIINVHDQDVTLSDVPVVNLKDGSYPDQAGGAGFTVTDGKLSGTVAAGRVAVAYDRQGTGVEFAPAIDLSVPSCDFITDSITVALNVRGCDSAVYQIDGGEETPFEDGTILTLGAELAGDESVTLTLTGVKGETVVTASATYTKRIYRADTIIYVDDEVRVKRGWAEGSVRVYLWGSGGANNGSWPGVRAELQTEGQWAGFWKYVLPFELENIEGLHAIINNGGSGGNNQIERGDMLISPGQIRVMNADEGWEDGAAEGYHKHLWDEGSVTAAPDCTQAGNTLYVCTVCGLEKNVSIPALGHDWDEGAETLAPSCTADGTRSFTCNRCGETREESIDALGHDFAEGVCTRCGLSDPNLGLTGWVLASQAPKAGDRVVAAVQTEEGWFALEARDFNRNPATGVALSVEDRILSEPAENLIWSLEEASYNSFTGLALQYGDNNLRFNSNRIRLQNNKQYGTFSIVPAGEAFKLRCDQNNSYLSYNGSAFTVAGAAYPIQFFVYVE